MGLLGVLLAFLRGLLLDRSALAAENLALRQQLNVLPRSVKGVPDRALEPSAGTVRCGPLVPVIQSTPCLSPPRNR